MHSGTSTVIVNGYQLLWDANTVLKPHRGTAAFHVFVTLTVLFLFLGASIVCVNNLKRTADLVF